MGFQLKGEPLVFAITLASALCFSCFGYDQGVFGGLLAAPSFLAQFNNPSASTLSTMTSVYPLGCLAGCIVSIIFAARLGRKRSIIVGCFFITVGGALQASAFSVGQIYAGRVIAGCGTGLTSSNVPIWVAECAKKGNRGRHIAIQMAFVISGSATAYWVDYGTLKHYSSEFAWRFPIAFQCAYAILGAFLVSLLPESPRILYAKGRDKEADAVLIRLLDCSSTDEAFIKQRTDILENLADEEHAEDEQPLWRAMLWDNSPLRNSRRVFIIVGIQLLQQMGGINAVTYYESTVLIDVVGLSTNMAELLAGVGLTSLFVGSLIAIYIIEAWGRRATLLVGSALTTISMIGLTVALKSALSSAKAGWAAFAFILLYQITFGLGWDCVPWIYEVEVSPLKYRHINASVAVATEWLFTFVTVKILPISIQNIGYRTYIIWTVFNAAQFVFTYLFVVETRGKSLEEIDYMFSAGMTHVGTDELKQDVEYVEKASPAGSTQF